MCTDWPAGTSAGHLSRRRIGVRVQAPSARTSTLAGMPPAVAVAMVALPAAGALPLDGPPTRPLDLPFAAGRAAGTAVVIPEGTPITVELATPLSATVSRSGDRFAATVVSPVMVQERMAVP